MGMVVGRGQDARRVPRGTRPRADMGLTGPVPSAGQASWTESSAAAVAAIGALPPAACVGVLSPANLARANAEMLLRGVGTMPTWEMEGHLQGIVRSLAQLERHVADVLVAGYPTGSGGLDLDWQDVDLGALVSARGEEYAGLYGRWRVTTSAQGGVPWVKGDGRRLRQAVDNLLDIALRHTPSDALVTVGVRRQADLLGVSSVGGPGVVVWVHVPVREPSLTLLEDLFDSALAGGLQGTYGAGLGLCTCRRIVAAHGGSLTLESQPRLGARLSFCVPVAGGPRQLPLWQTGPEVWELPTTSLRDIPVTAA